MKTKCLRIGHRGAEGYCAENTLESIQKALNIIVDGIEIDVHLCASGELVVFHDFTLERMTNGIGEVSNLSLSELKKLKVKGKYSIPTLAEVMNSINKKCILNIELKGQHTASEACRIIQYYIENKNWNYQQFLISSFQHHELENVYGLNKNIPLAVLTEASVDEAIEFGQAINAVAIHPNYALLTKDNVKRAQDFGFIVNTWTVNDIPTIERMKYYGVDAIISDFPDRI